MSCGLIIYPTVTSNTSRQFKQTDDGFSYCLYHYRNQLCYQQASQINTHNHLHMLQNGLDVYVLCTVCKRHRCCFLIVLNIFKFPEHKDFEGIKRSLTKLGVILTCKWRYFICILCDLALQSATPLSNITLTQIPGL